MTTTEKSKTASSTSAGQDVTKILKADHKLVTNLFTEFENSRSSSKKRELVEEICKELTIHAQLEEEIFYPAVLQATKDRELVPEALVEHNSLKGLIDSLKGVEPDGELYEATVKVLSEYVKHHVKEEEGEMFTLAKNSKLNLEELGAVLEQRKLELMEKYA